MANILRMDLYRLVHGKSLWIMLGVIVCMAVVSAAFMAYVSSPAYLDSLQAAGASGTGGIHIGITAGNGPDAGDDQDAAEAAALMTAGTSAEALVGTLFLNGGGLAVLFVIFIAIFLAAEFESGFSKNVFTVQPNRLAFLATRTVEVVVLAAAFVVVTVAATLATAFAAGFELAPIQPWDLALWGALVTLALAGFGMLTALVTWLTRKMAPSLVVGILLGAGIATLLVQGLVLLVPSASFVADCTLSACMASLALGVDQAGGLSSLHIALTALAFIAASVALGGVALQKKDV